MSPGVSPHVAALSAGAFRAFAPKRAIEGFSVEALEVHSTRVARLATELLPDRRAAEEAFTAGMLHDVGKLLLATHHPDELAALLNAARTSRRPLHVVEQERVAVTHAEIGAYLLTLWGLPYSIVEAVAHHHAPERLGEAKLDPLAAIHIADLLICEQERLHCGGAAETVDEHYLVQLGAAEQLESRRRMAADRVHGSE